MVERICAESVEIPAGGSIQLTKSFTSDIGEVTQVGILVYGTDGTLISSAINDWRYWGNTVQLWYQLALDPSATIGSTLSITLDYEYGNEYVGAWLTDNFDIQVTQSEDHGEEWYIQYEPAFGTKHFNAVQFLDSNEGWVVGWDGYVLKTTNGGILWQKVDIGSDLDLEDVHFVDSENGWICSSETTVFKTTDGGENWTPQETGITEYLRDIDFPSINVGYAVGTNGTFLKTPNGGDLWAPANLGTNNNLLSIHCVSTDMVWIAGIGPTILATTNGGNLWTSFTVDYGNYYLYDIFFIDENFGWVAGPINNILNTTNAGENWNDQIPGVDSNLRSVHFVDQQTGWAVGFNGIIVKTVNGGDNWVVQSEDIFEPLESVFFVNENTGWAVGRNQILKTEGGGGAPFTYISDEHGLSNLPNQFKLSSNYPNPFNPVTTINYGLPEEGHVKIIIYNVMGRVVDVLVDNICSAGYHKVVWDAGNFPCGIYFYRMETVGYTQMRKMLLIK